MRARDDTIVAIATPPGRGAVGIVRTSGPLARKIAQDLLHRVPSPRRAVFGPFHDETSVLDEGLALFFPAPHSFTGEDVLELQGHGGPVVLDLIVKRALTLGARLARPGEFSERAFLNGKLDLVQAEAVADLIESASAAGARSAVRSLQGAFSDAVRTLTAGVIELRLHAESAIDFVDEDVTPEADEALSRRTLDLIAAIAALRQQADEGRILHDGLAVALVGAPNTGKSSLLNALAGDEAAIVSATAGTTRDLLRVSLTLNGVPIELVDTAGLRAAEDEIEREGVRRAEQAARQSDLLLLVLDDRAPEPRPAIPEGPCLLVYNKIDLTGRRPGRIADAPFSVAVSARTGEGLDDLRTLVSGRGCDAAASGLFSARRRHLDALARAGRCLAAGLETHRAHRGLELFAEDLRQAQRALDEITGRFTPDDLLGQIFSTFCIGK
ncbi:MAG: tRNA uridine-5-carboxymethylaminomethyl(34) synthesis GTPase MnmE [Acidiferrobacteraceae bacterium]